MGKRPPTAGELDCLSVLWDEAEKGVSAMGLSAIHRSIVNKRTAAGESEPALTTVSTYLRSALAKGLLEETRFNGNGQVEAKPRRPRRGALARTRSPKTAYRAAVTPRELFHDTIAAIADTYPTQRRLELLVDVASVLNVPERVKKQLDEWVKRKTRRMSE